MTFYKPSNITYTEMAQWVDAQNIQNCSDEETLVKYLYLLVLFKAKQLALFKDNETYDDFALFSVGKLLIRLNNKEEAPVKSIMNYIKTVIGFWDAEYVREFCVGSPDCEIADFNIGDFGDYLVDACSEFDTHSFSVGCPNISAVIRTHLKKIPVRKNSAEWSNIYLSCLLTFKDRVDSAIDISSKITDNEDPLLFNRVIRKLKTKQPILFHLDESYANYISILVNEITHAIAAELTFTTASKVSTTACLRNMVAAANNNEDD